MTSHTPEGTIIKHLFQALTDVNLRPSPYERVSTRELWTDPYISKKMLEYHLDEKMDLASRQHEFIDRSVAWIDSRFGLAGGKRVCDFGCGPGLYTQRFAQRGAVVTGLDFSANSIAHARQAAERAGLSINYVLGDYLEFESDQVFDLITLIFCDLCPLTPQNRQRLLEKFANLLAPDGSLLMDVCSLAAFDARHEQRSYEYCKEDGFWSPHPHFVFHNVFKYREEKLTLDKYTIMEPNGSWQSFHWLRHFDLDSLAHELGRAGLELVEHYANVAGDPHKPDSPEIALVARKAD